MKNLQNEQFETFILQATHQTITFEPRGFFAFNYNLIVELIAFAATYNAVFLQFYLL